jgi:hypothetical protein
MADIEPRLAELEGLANEEERESEVGASSALAD